MSALFFYKTIFLDDIQHKRHQMISTVQCFIDSSCTFIVCLQYISINLILPKCYNESMWRVNVALLTLQCASMLMFCCSLAPFCVSTCGQQNFGPLYEIPITPLVPCNMVCIKAGHINHWKLGINFWWMILWIHRSWKKRKNILFKVFIANYKSCYTGQVHYSLKVEGGPLNKFCKLVLF